MDNMFERRNKSRRGSNASDVSQDTIPNYCRSIRCLLVTCRLEIPSQNWKSTIRRPLQSVSEDKTQQNNSERLPKHDFKSANTQKTIRIHRFRAENDEILVHIFVIWRIVNIFFTKLIEKSESIWKYLYADAKSLCAVSAADCCTIDLYHLPIVLWDRIDSMNLRWVGCWIIPHDIFR